MSDDDEWTYLSDEQIERVEEAIAGMDEDERDALEQYIEDVQEIAHDQWEQNGGEGSELTREEIAYDHIYGDDE